MAKKQIEAYHKQSKRIPWAMLFKLLPVYLTVGLLPFLVRICPYEHHLEDFAWYYQGADTTFGDSFLIYRQWWFTACFFYMLLVVIGKFFLDKKSLRLCITAIPLGVYAFFSLLSATFSKFGSFSFTGSFEQFENVFVLMGYALIVYYSFLVLDSEEEVRSILAVLTFSTISLGIIGTLQTLGVDVLGSSFVKKLIVPRSLSVDVKTTTADNTAVMTLYNPNYVGVYVATLFPLYLGLLLFTKKWKDRLLYALTVLLLLVSLYGSGSKAAFLVLAVLMLVFFVFLRKPILRFWYLVIPSLTALVLVFLLVNQWRDHVFTDRIKSALQPHETVYRLESIETADDGIHVIYEGNEFIVRLNQTNEEIYTFDLVDAYESTIYAELQEDGATYQFLDPRFGDCKVTLLYYDNILCFDIVIDGQLWRFTNQRDNTGKYYYLTTKGKFDELHMAEQVLFSKHESLFSGRGYIWSVTIPLLKKHIFLGSGPDTFVMEFPQQDYMRLWRNGYAAQIMSKPHSLYLQVGVQDGVIAMLGLIAFLVLYLLQSVYLYINAKFQSFYEGVGVSIMLSVLGFAVMGISNDSSVTVSPIFFAIVGVGIYVNSKVHENKSERTEKTEKVEYTEKAEKAKEKARNNNKK